MFWKMACRERQCLRGGANSAQISGAPWSNSYALYMVHRRRTQREIAPAVPATIYAILSHISPSIFLST
jgi:hypothetical protein